MEAGSGDLCSGSGNLLWHGARLAVWRPSNEDPIAPMHSKAPTTPTALPTATWARDGQSHLWKKRARCASLDAQHGSGARQPVDTSTLRQGQPGQVRKVVLGLFDHCDRPTRPTRPTRPSGPGNLALPPNWRGVGTSTPSVRPKTGAGGGLRRLEVLGFGAGAVALRSVGKSWQFTRGSPRD